MTFSFDLRYEKVNISEIQELLKCIFDFFGEYTQSVQFSIKQPIKSRLIAIFIVTKFKEHYNHFLTFRPVGTCTSPSETSEFG